VGVDEVWGAEPAEDCARELLGEGGSADWLERSEALEPVEGACSAEAVELSDRDWEAPVPAVASGAAFLAPRVTRELLNRHMLPPAATPQQRAARQQLGMLSPREREVAELVAQGLTNAEIAQRLTIAADSVKKNVTRILGKLNLRDRVQLVILLRDAQP